MQSRTLVYAFPNKWHHRRNACQAVANTIRDHQGVFYSHCCTHLFYILHSLLTAVGAKTGLIKREQLLLKSIMLLTKMKACASHEFFTPLLYLISSGLTFDANLFSFFFFSFTVQFRLSNTSNAFCIFFHIPHTTIQNKSNTKILLRIVVAAAVALYSIRSFNAIADVFNFPQAHTQPSARQRAIIFNILFCFFAFFSDECSSD